MLTADLVQARVYRGEVRPRYIDPADPDRLALAGELIELFAAHPGRPRHALARELEGLIGTGTEFLLHRGLAKLLFDRSSFDTEAPIAPETLRRAVFEAAARAYREDSASRPAALDRETLLREVGAELELEPEAIERGLYADLKDEQILQEWRPCRPDWLLRRYNVALAQGVLLRASELEIELEETDVRKCRALFQKIKFFQLLHEIEGDAAAGYRIRLDGPLSLFRASGKYGVQMASFLPTLLHFDRWTLRASVLWGRARLRREFRLSSSDALRPYTRLTGQWQPEEVAWLPEQLGKLTSDWTVTTDAEVIHLGGQGVLVPDFVFRHRPSGREVVMEVLGFWRRGAVASRLELLRRHGPPNLVLALSKQLAAGREDLGEIPGEVFVFRSTLVARKLLKVLDSFLESA